MKITWFFFVVFMAFVCSSVYGQSQLSLNPEWQKSPGFAKELVVEFSQLAGSFVKPKIDLNGDQGREIFNGITYLMPLDDARLKIGGGRLAPVSSTVVCVAAGFPAKSITVSEFRGNFADGFPSLFLLTDLKKQVVAAQLLDRNPKLSFLSGHTEERAFYDFVKQKRKGVPYYKVAAESKMDGRIVIINSELVDGVFKPRERARLLMPDKFASIVLALLQGVGTP
jgi:hypothetical protein